MQAAIEEAVRARRMDEVPIGAVAVTGGKIVDRAHNIREATADPLGHAELLLLRKLSDHNGDWRQENLTVYVTCEPCIMCMGALLQARVPKLVYGCADPNAGACGSLYDLSNDTRLYHQIEVVSGILADECGELLKDFFRKLRA